MTETVTPAVLTKPQAAAYLGMSVRHLERTVMPRIKIVRHGRMVRIGRAELDRWIAERERFDIEP